MADTAHITSRRIPAGAKATTHSEATIVELLPPLGAQPILTEEMVDREGWDRAFVTAATLAQFGNIGAAATDELVEHMIEYDAPMISRILERADADIAFLSAALSAMRALDGRISDAADRVLRARAS